MKMFALTVVAVATLVLSFVIKSPDDLAAQQAPRIAIVMFTGGSVDEFVAATGGQAMTIWATVGGQLVGYVVGAPPFVSAAFMAAFPNGEIASNTGLLVVMPAGAPQLPSVLEPGAAPPPAGLTVTSLATWDGEETPLGSFRGLNAVAVGADGTVYVLDHGPEFATGPIPGGTSYAYVFRPGGDLLAVRALPGENLGLAVDAPGNLFVTARMAPEPVRVLSPDGTVLAEWGRGHLEFPGAVAVDGAGNVYVADGGRAHVFSAEGAFLRAVGSGGFDIAVDQEGNVYLTDFQNHRVQVFGPDGALLRAWGSEGGGEGQFSGPTGIALDGAGNVYVADLRNHRVQVFDTGGRFLGTWSSGSTGGRLESPTGIALGPGGIVYVSEGGTAHRVQIFRVEIGTAPQAAAPSGGRSRCPSCRSSS